MPTDVVLPFHIITNPALGNLLRVHFMCAVDLSQGRCQI